MNFMSFQEWALLKEGKKDRTYQTSEPKISDVEKLRIGKNIKVNTAEVKDRIPTGRPASACGMGGGRKYDRGDRRKFKRIED